MTPVTPLAFVGYTLLQLLVLSAIVVSLTDLSARALRRDNLLAFSAAVLALGVLGYLTFWLAFASYALAGVVKIALLVALLGNLLLVAVQRNLRAYAWLTEPLLYVSLLTATLLMIALSNGGFDHLPSAIANRFGFWLPADNELPWIAAEALKSGVIASPMAGDWLFSDRPPLQTGLYQLLALQRGWVGYQIVATWLQATFLFGVWAVLVAAAVSPSVRRLTMLACCVLPTVIVNTMYTWPKMLAAGYLLFVFALVFLRPATDRALTGVLIGGFAALAMLCHGTSAFALVGFAIAVIAFWAWPPFVTMAVGAASILALYVPWALFQSFVDPPGNRLLKWHLAGAMSIDGRSSLQTLRDVYGALTWNDFLAARLANLRTIVGDWPLNLCGLSDPSRIRAQEFFHLMPSLGYFSIAALLAVLMLPFADARLRALALRMLVAILATIVVTVLLSFLPGSAINHQSSYVVPILLTIFSFVLLSSRLPVVAWLFAAAQCALVLVVYGVTLKHDVALWPLLGIATVTAAGLLAYSFAPALRRTG